MPYVFFSMSTILSDALLRRAFEQFSFLRESLQGALKVTQETISIVGMAFKVVLVPKILSADHGDLLLQRAQTAYGQTRRKVCKRKLLPFQISFNNAGAIQRIPAIDPVHCHTYMGIFKAGTGKVNKAGQILVFKEEIPLVVVSARKGQRRLN